jgi:hypothetical protein
MNVETAMIHLAAYREGKVTDPRLSKALRCIENESMQRERLAEQVAFDLSVQEMLGAIAAPVDLRRRLTVAQGASEKPPVRPRHHLTAVLSLGLGVAIIIAVLVFIHLQNRNDFPGRENLVRLASSSNRMSGVELEPVGDPADIALGRGHQPAGELGDWFYMRGFEGYRLPAELRSLPAVGSRFFKPDGHPVAQIAVDTHQSLLYVFKGDDFGVTLPSADDWAIFPAPGCVAAARQFDNSMVMITFQGTEAEMQDFVATLKTKKKPPIARTP